MISKYRKIIYLLLRGNKVIQTHNFRNLLNDLWSFAIIFSPTDVDDPELILVKTSESDDIRCPMLNALEFNVDANKESFCSQAC